VTSAWVFGLFSLASARFFASAAEVLRRRATEISAKQRNVTLQRAARQLRVTLVQGKLVVACVCRPLV